MDTVHIFFFSFVGGDNHGFYSLLGLYNNNMTEELPLVVTQMPNLRHLHLRGDFFAGQIPPEYGRWEQLEYLAISDNELADTIPSEIGNLTNLQELYIGYYNTYVGGILSKIGNLSELVRLNAANCKLIGEIPPELRKLQKLDTLFLQVKALLGSLTRELGTLLNLFRNKLHGAIPQFIGELP